MVVFAVLGMISPLSAQNLASSLHSTDSSLKADGVHGIIARFQDSSVVPGSYEVPALEKAQGDVSDETAVFTPQDATTLNSKSAATAREVEAVVDLDVLRNPSPYRRVLVSTSGMPTEVATDTLNTGLARISAVYRESGTPEKSSNCLNLTLSVEERVKMDVSQVLEIVETEVSANSNCACEIVKAAIKASEADVEQVVAIVETAITAAPDTMRIVSQCAIAALPESVTAVQALLARLDPNAGEDGYSSKSAKSSKDAKDSKVASIVAPPIPNPLDLPPSGPPLTPILIVPDPVTEVNPGVFQY
jgi:hypothetical protein